MSPSLSVDSCLIVVDGSVDVTFIPRLISVSVQNPSTFLTPMSVLASALSAVHYVLSVLSTQPLPRFLCLSLVSRWILTQVPPPSTLFFVKNENNIRHFFS